MGKAPATTVAKTTTRATTASKMPTSNFGAGKGKGKGKTHFKDDKKRPRTRSVRSGLIFPVGRIHRLMKCRSI